MSQVILAEYGRAKTINFDLYEVDGVDFRVDAADAGADCSIMKDEGAEGTCANDFVDEGQSYSLVLTAAEMQAARATILIVDSATKVWLDKHVYIETYGHPSSAHPFMTPYWTNGAVNDGSASSTVFTFDGFTEATAEHVTGSELTFTNGANAGQARPVSAYTSTQMTVSPGFLAAPADNDEFVLRALPASASLEWVNGQRLDTLLDAIPTTAMRGTDSAALASEVTSTRMSELDDSAGKLVAVADLIKTAADAIKLETDKLTLGDAGAGSAGSIIEEIENRPTTAMRGTDNAALASVMGALNDAASADDPTTADTVMQYVKQLINILIGAAGIANLRAAAAPANNVSLSEMIRSIFDDTNSLDGTKIPDTLSLANINSEVDTAWTTQMADSVPADGTIPTREEMLYMVGQFLMDFAISSTTRTTKKVDGSTALMTHTLDDDTAPTSLTRAT